MYSGGCLCGKVTYTYAGEIQQVSMCHCKQCRTAQGSAFVAVCPVDATLLVFEGEKHIKRYESTEGKYRAFCGECGSPLYSANEELPSIKRLRLGSLDQQVKPDNRYHKFVNHKADWFDIVDGLTQFGENNT